MIKLLPDSIANQIAAGEVVQRPSSIVKELLENAVDSGANSIKLIIKDAGRTLVQVIDNGSGMSFTDARLAFERHATSKISKAEDLNHIVTMGFRGEALPSIAAVAEVELKTKKTEEETGAHLIIQASKVISHEPIQSAQGSNFAVKNLFFNIPARRKFLKSDTVELKHIMNEFQRVAIARPDISFTFSNNGNEIYNLPKGNLRQRLTGMFGKNIGSSLIDVGIETNIIKLSGFISKPDKSRKSLGEQFFFVNNRFFRSAYLQKAVFKAYEQLLTPDSYPSFFLFLEIDPSSIDVNIHPAKTEIKFENETNVWQILNAVVRESLSRYAIAPSIIFDTEGAVDIPVLNTNTEVHYPTVTVNENFNPFNEESKISNFTTKPVTGWDNLYAGLERNALENFENASQPQIFTQQESGSGKRFMMIKNKYIATTVKSGLMLIDVYRAHQRVLYEKYYALLQNQASHSQKQLYPQTIDLAIGDYMLMQSIMPDLEDMGFDVRSFGPESLVFYSFPAGLEQTDAVKLVEEILKELKNEYNNPEWTVKDKLARSFASTDAIRNNKLLNETEMQHLVDSLFACAMPDITPDGKTIISILAIEEIENRF